MRKNSLVGVAYGWPLADWGGKNKCPCIGMFIARGSSTNQFYPMKIYFYETE